jgi:hypothetical protein
MLPELRRVPRDGAYNLVSVKKKIKNTLKAGKFKL